MPDSSPGDARTADDDQPNDEEVMRPVWSGGVSRDMGGYVKPHCPHDGDEEGDVFACMAQPSASMLVAVSGTCTLLSPIRRSPRGLDLPVDHRMVLAHDRV